MSVSGEEYRALDAEALVRRLRQDEDELAFARFDLDDAWAVGSWLRATAKERGHAVGFAIVFGEHRAFAGSTPGASALNDAWLDRKFRLVQHYGRSSLAVRAEYAAKGERFETHGALDPQRYAAAGGGFPLRVGGALAGAIGVSGLEMHDDHALVVEALRAHRDAS